MVHFLSSIAIESHNVFPNQVSPAKNKVPRHVYCDREICTYPHRLNSLPQLDQNHNPIVLAIMDRE